MSIKAAHGLALGLCCIGIVSGVGHAEAAPLAALTAQVIAASGGGAASASDPALFAIIPNASPECSVAVMTSLRSAARCDVDFSNDDGDGTAGVGVDNMDHGAKLADFPTSISVGVDSYTFTDWLDVLRVLWAGADHTRTSNEGGLNGQSALNRASRCGSAIRRALVSNWDNVVEDLASGNACGRVPAAAGLLPRSCENPSTGVALPLRHLFRPADTAAVSSTFLSLLGLATINNQPFCNGTDAMDDDPIRVRCSVNTVQPTPPLADSATQLNDETCGPDQTTGLVLAIRIPAVVSADTPLLFPTANCDTGRFDVRRPPQSFNNVRTCPDGAPYLFTGCLTPISARADCRCVNAWTNRAPGTTDLNPTLGGIQNDGRVWNRYYRGRATATNACPVLASTDLPAGPVLADARLRYRTKTVNDVSVPSDRVCRFASSTEQLGCLSQAAECSIGFENPEALVDDTFNSVTYRAATLLEGPTCF